MNFDLINYIIGDLVGSIRTVVIIFAVLIIRIIRDK